MMSQMNCVLCGMEKQMETNFFCPECRDAARIGWAVLALPLHYELRFRHYRGGFSAFRDGPDQHASGSGKSPAEALIAAGLMEE